ASQPIRDPTSRHLKQRIEQIPAAHHDAGFFRSDPQIGLDRLAGAVHRRPLHVGGHGDEAQKAEEDVAHYGNAPFMRSNNRSTSSAVSASSSHPYGRRRRTEGNRPRLTIRCFSIAKKPSSPACSCKLTIAQMGK